MNHSRNHYSKLSIVSWALCSSFFVLYSSCSLAQDFPSLFHQHKFNQVGAQTFPNKRAWKTRLDAGLVFGYYNFDPHYTNAAQRSGGYTLGAKEEIPILRSGSFLIGFDYVSEGASFNSYFFAPGYSVFYSPAEEIYTHTLTIEEFHFPVEYKFPFTPETRLRTFYGLIGWDYRLLIYDNVTVVNSQNGNFIFEGQNNLNCLYHIFSNQGSAMIVFALGYQRNFPAHGNAWFIEFNYRYGVSPIIYTGNNMGSNNVQFTLNTLSLKVGIKI